MSPGLMVLPGAVTDQVNALLIRGALFTVAVNCCCVPITTVAGVIVMDGVGGGAEDFPQAEIIRHAAEIAPKAAGQRTMCIRCLTEVNRCWLLECIAAYCGITSSVID